MKTCAIDNIFTIASELARRLEPAAPPRNFSVAEPAKHFGI
jgi:hypothetical protein